MDVPSAQETIQFEVVHPQLEVYAAICLRHNSLCVSSYWYIQFNNFSAEPSGPWDGGDDIVLSITFSHVMVGQKNITNFFTKFQFHSSPLLATLPMMC